jgi:hypothetical protein
MIARMRGERIVLPLSASVNRKLKQETEARELKLALKMGRERRMNPKSKSGLTMPEFHCVARRTRQAAVKNRLTVAPHCPCELLISVTSPGHVRER